MYNVYIAYVYIMHICKYCIQCIYCIYALYNVVDCLLFASALRQVVMRCAVRFSVLGGTTRTLRILRRAHCAALGRNALGKLWVDCLLCRTFVGSNGDKCDPQHRAVSNVHCTYFGGPLKQARIRSQIQVIRRIRCSS